MMKKGKLLVIMLLVVSLCFGSAFSVYATRSINDDSRRTEVVDDGKAGDNDNAIIYYFDDGIDHTADQSQYGLKEYDNIYTSLDRIKNEDAREIVKDLTKGENIDVADVVELIKQSDQEKKDPTEFPTTTGKVVNLELYDFATKFMYIENPGSSVTIRVPEAIGTKAEDNLIMFIDPETGEVYLIEPTKLNSETGEMTVKLPGSGLFAVVQKVPIVVRDVDPDRYNKKDIAEAVMSLPQDECLELSDWMKAFGVKGNRLEVAKGVTVNVSDYSSANYMADIAVRLGRDDFGYRLSTDVNAKLYQELDEIDWERVLDYAGIDYDKEAFEKDRTLLKDIEPFVLEDSFIYHFDATTGEPSICYEPIITFMTTDELDNHQTKYPDGIDSPTAAKDSDSDRVGIIPVVYAAEKVVDEEDEVIKWKIKDIDNESDDEMNMVMSHDQYLGMGPFAIFLPKDKISSSFDWWWLLIILAIAAAIYFVTRKKKTEEDA